MRVRDRIREFRRVPASELKWHPLNWRTHPTRQRCALSGVLKEIGYAGALLARECADGSLELIDGHLRAAVTPDQEVPVLVLDVTEQEAATLLATHDPLASLAERDDDQLAALLEQVSVESTAVQGLLEELACQSQLPPTDFTPAEDDTDRLSETIAVLVTCDSEAEQADLLQKLTAEGYQCRALNA